MDNKIAYKRFCESQYVPIFSQPWWLDAVCGENNWEVWIYRVGDSVLAAMPYKIDGQGKSICRAPITQNNGVLIAYPKGQKYCSRLDYEDKIINSAIDYIESKQLESYEQQFHYTYTNWLPFFWRGYEGVVRYTYVINDTSELEIIVKNFDTNLRKNIKKAMKIVNIRQNLLPEKLYQLNSLTFSRQGREQMPHSYETVASIISACEAHSCCKILYAEDAEKNIHGAILLVWDEQSMYYLLSGSDPQYRSSQANSLLIYEGIKLASQKGLKFDFEGSVVKQIECNFRQFGGIRMPYFRISKRFTDDLNPLNMENNSNGGGGGAECIKIQALIICLVPFFYGCSWKVCVRNG